MNKLIALLSLAYVIWPIDLIPDMIPVLGWVDDAVAAVVGVSALLKRPKK